VTSPDTHELPNAETEPFEFALLTLNLVDEEAFALEDDTSVDAELLEGGFSLQYSLGTDLEFSLSYDEEKCQYTAAVRCMEPLLQMQTALLALQLNHLMPQERRFSVDALTQCLVLHETWSTIELDMVRLAEGLSQLIEAMLVFLSPAETLTAEQTQPALLQPMLRV
jgi:hypothetical protein